MEENRSRNTYI